MKIRNVDMIVWYNNTRTYTHTHTRFISTNTTHKKYFLRLKIRFRFTFAFGQGIIRTEPSISSKKGKQSHCIACIFSFVRAYEFVVFFVNRL